MTATSPPYRGANGGSADTRTVRDDVHRTVDDARHGAAGRVEGIAESIDAAASHLGQEDMTRLSGYVHDMAQSLAGFASDLRDKNGDEMLADVKRMARQNPALFLGSSVAIGFGLSRFARATKARDRQLPVRMAETRTGLSPTPTAHPPASPDYGDLP